jgi:hypothetical protein
MTALVVAAIAYRLVENPIRFHPKLMKRPLLTLGMAAAITVCSFTIATASRWLAVRMGNAPQMKVITAAVDDIADMPRTKCVGLGASSNVPTCAFGNRASETTVVLFGDSHAIQWFNALQSIAQLHGWKLVTFVKSGCPAADIVPPASGAAFEKGCNAWRAEAIREIVALRPSLAVVASATTYLDANRKNGRKRISPQEWQAGSRRTLGALSAAGVNVAVMRDTPRPAVDIPTCLGRAASHSWYRRSRCDLDRSAALRPEAFAAERAAADGLPSVSFLDMTDQLCQASSCPAMKDGRIVYRDDNHLTGTFAASLSPTVDAKLLPLVSPSR